MGVYAQFFDSNSEYSFIFDDDGRVAFGYLLRRGKINAEVWLYNIKSPPIKIIPPSGLNAAAWIAPISP